jgi:hypothetical protein
MLTSVKMSATTSLFFIALLRRTKNSLIISMPVSVSEAAE